MVIEADRQNFDHKKELKMTTQKRTLTVKLTNEQQKQIRDATGKNTAELNIDLTAKGLLSEKDLDRVAGGEAPDEEPLQD
jgi:hypothetical protein